MEEKMINAGRQFELDFAKFIAIVFMILVHCYDYSPLYISPVTLSASGTTTLGGSIVEFLGAQPAATVFMFCMGIGLVYTSHNSPSEMARRGLKLLLTGYLLNLYRTLIAAGGLILSGAVEGSDILPLVSRFFLCVDILPFAGLAFLFFALMKRLGMSHLSASAIVLLMLVVSQYLPVIDDGHQWYCYLIGLLWYQCDFTSFPLFQWLPFPMAGVLFGTMLRQTTYKHRFYLKTLALGLPMLGLATAIAWLTGRDIHSFFTSNYFNMDVLQTAWSLGIVLTLLPVYFYMTGFLHNEQVRSLATFCSRNINKIYLWQWIIITPLALVALYVVPVDTFWKLLVEALLVFLFSIAIVSWRNSHGHAASTL